VPPPLLLVLAALLALAIHLAVLCTAAPAAYVVEQVVGVLAALSRSRRLVRGAWWRTFAALALVGLPVAVLAVVVLVPLAAQAASTSVVLLEYLGMIVVATVAVPFGSTAAGILYVDLRIRGSATTSTSLGPDPARASSLAAHDLRCTRRRRFRPPSLLFCVVNVWPGSGATGAVTTTPDPMQMQISGDPRPPPPQQHHRVGAVTPRRTAIRPRDTPRVAHRSRPCLVVATRCAAAARR
jgi:hypothetical protein